MCSIFRCVDADVNTPVSEWHFDEFLKHPAETTAALKTAVIKEEMKTFMLYCQAAKEATKATKMCDPASGIESYEPGRFCPLSDSLCPRLSLQPPHRRDYVRRVLTSMCGHLMKIKRDKNHSLKSSPETT